MTSTARVAEPLAAQRSTTSTSTTCSPPKNWPSGTGSAPSSTSGSGRTSPTGTPTRHFPRELVKELAALGLLGMHLKGYGCAGRSAVEYGIAAMELEAGDSGIRTFVSVQGSLAMSAIYKFGSEEQKQRWLPGMAAGEVIGCFGLTEPTAGSDPANMVTEAVRDGDGLGAQRCQAVDRPGDDRRRRDHLGEDGPTRAIRGLRGADRRRRASPPRHRAQTVHARVDPMRHRLDDVRLPADALLPGRPASRARSPA